MESDQLVRLAHTLLISPEVFSRKIEKQILTIALKDLHLSMGIYHLLVLQVLADEGDQAVNEVGKKLAISKSQMTFATNRLVDLALINRQMDDEDRRKIRIGLTLRGRWVLEELTKNFQKEMTRLLNDLPDEDIIALESGLLMLDRISERL